MRPEPFFCEAFHEPGAARVLGSVYPDSGPDQAREILAHLAGHPATARHLGRKLAAHFVTADPPAELVDRLSATFLETRGDLRALAVALISWDAAWDQEPRKILPPYDLVIAANRLLQRPPAPLALIIATARLGQRIWGPSSPAGFPDIDDYWAGPDLVLERLDWASRLAAAAAGRRDIEALAREAVGEASEHTLRATRDSEGRGQALALLLMSPEFQMR